MSASAIMAAALMAAQPTGALPAEATPPVAVAPVPQAPPSEAPQPGPGVTPAPVPTAPQPVPPARAQQGQPGSEIVVTARHGPPPGDPAQAVNQASFAAVQGVDKVLVGPVAAVYEKATPKPVRKGLHNVLNNLSEPINAVNFLLQLKPGRAFKSLGRFAINTTIGIGGVMDVAAKKPFNLPYARNGFANTLGYYGIGPGPYMYLPLIGPTTLRDLTGRLLDLSLVPRVVGQPFSSPTYAVSTGVVRSLDERVAMDDFLKRMRKECDNPYAAERQYYLLTRQAEIEGLHGRTMDLSDKLPSCLVDGPMVPIGQATPATGASVEPSPAAPQPAVPSPAPTQSDTSPPPGDTVQPAVTPTT